MKFCKSLKQIMMDETQKQIMNQKGVQQSQYVENITSLNSIVSNVNGELRNAIEKKRNKGVAVKNGSYQRYLNRKKGKVISNQGYEDKDADPKYGNKRKSISLTSKSNNVKCSSLKLCK